MDKRTFLRTGICGAAGTVLCPMDTMAKNNPAGVPTETETGKNPGKPWKWSRVARYQVETPRGVRCQICPNECTLGEGEVSDCHNRRVYEGTLYTLAYGNPCALHIDPIEKKPLFHFLPASNAFSIATAGCNLACLNCQNWTISQSSPEETRNYDLMPEKVVEGALEYKTASIAYTYSEPITAFEYVFDTASLAREAGIRNVLVSAGYIHPEPLRDLCTVIDAANIDLKSMDDAIYLKLNAGKLEPVLNGLKIFRDMGVWLEITNLVVPSWTDNMDMIKRMCQWLVSNGFENNPLHFSRFHPQYKLQRLAPTPVNTLESARSIALAEGLKFVYIGNVPGTNATNTFCPGCGKLMVERSGYTIKTNLLKDNPVCDQCHTRVPGIWS